MLGVAAARVCIAGESDIVVCIRGCLCYPGMVGCGVRGRGSRVPGGCGCGPVDVVVTLGRGSHGSGGVVVVVDVWAGIESALSEGALVTRI